MNPFHPASIFLRARAYTAVVLAFCLFFASGPLCEAEENSPERSSTSTESQALDVDMPYEINGEIYYPLQSAKNYSEVGVASWYGPDFHGKRTSNREVYNMHSMTAAHRTLPFGTRVKVINLENRREAVVRINDRGPFARKRVIDLSRGAAEKLGIVRAGTARVKLIALPDRETRRTTSLRKPTEGAFAVQVAVFEKADNAELIKNQLENSRIKTYLRGSKETHRVMIGNFPSFEHAVALRDQVRKLGFPDAFIVRDD